MIAAMDAVKNGLLGVNRAAMEFGVPKTTLKDRIAGRVIHGTNIGRDPFLSKQEEEELVKFLVKCSKMGFGKTRAEVLKIVEATLTKKNGNDEKYPTVGGGVFDKGGLKLLCEEEILFHWHEKK